jgi:hypothetical protein
MRQGNDGVCVKYGIEIASSPPPDHAAPSSQRQFLIYVIANPDYIGMWQSCRIYFINTCHPPTVAVFNSFINDEQYFKILLPYYNGTLNDIYLIIFSL